MDMQTKLAAVTPWNLGAPMINGAAVFGAGRGSPFFYPVPVTGERPITFNATGLPPGLSIDSTTGLITGRGDTEGEFMALITAVNVHGHCDRKLTIRIGDRICLTPPLGWNSWNAWGATIAENKVRQGAEYMVSSGLAARGFSYINIDDGWQGERGGPLNALQPNSKFGNMKALCDDIHALGLRIGIYSTPWVKTYAGYNGGSCGPCAQSVPSERLDKGWYIGQHSHHKEDARQWAQWGIDYLKYDWGLWHTSDVQAMRDALNTSGRDILYSLSNSAPFDQAAEWARYANCWRTTGDIQDEWITMSGIGFTQDQWVPYAGPGHWNDPDMLVVGKLGWGNIRENRLTHDEQITHITLWSLLAAPLLLGCDLSVLDDFTLRLLANREVLAVNQDSLGTQAHCVRELRKTDVGGKVTTHESIFAKPLDDGSLAVGLFNRSSRSRIVEVSWEELGWRGTCSARDLWAGEDRGTFAERFSMGVPAHGAQMLKIRPTS